MKNLYYFKLQLSLKIPICEVLLNRIHEIAYLCKIFCFENSFRFPFLTIHAQSTVLVSYNFLSIQQVVTKFLRVPQQVVNFP